jgi:hypothetical protein
MDILPTEDTTPFPLSRSNESRKNPRPPKPKPYCTKDAIEEMLETEAAACILWAEDHENLARTGSPEQCKKDAEYIIEKWRAAMATKATWTARIPTEIPQLESNSVTIGVLHAHLTKLLALHPDVADVVVEYEQCCGWFEARDVFFDDEKSVLRIS